MFIDELPTEIEGSMLGNLFVQSTSIEERNNVEDNLAVAEKLNKDAFNQSKEIVRLAV